jgi:hypothetical protein
LTYRIAIDVVIDNLVGICIIRNNFIAESRMENEVSMPMSVIKIYFLDIIQIGIYDCSGFRLLAMIISRAPVKAA